MVKMGATYKKVNYRNCPRYPLQLTTGTYVGDGNNGRTVTGLGFQPKILIVYEQQGNPGSDLVFFKTDKDGVYVKGSYGVWYSDRIVSLDTDGFTIGTNVNYVNENGQTYTYIAATF